MARHQAFLSPEQEHKNNSVQQTISGTRRTNDRTTMERKKEDLIALPPVRTTTNSEAQADCKQLTPLTKWQIQRCCSPNPGHCQEELVNDWLHRNHIRVVQRLPKMDPIVLTSRGTDVSKYFSFIHPPPFRVKVFSSEGKKSGENTKRRAQTVSAESSSLCPRLLRSQRSETEIFPVNPVIRVGGGYRRLSWKVLDVLPSIGEYEPDFSPPYSCGSCHARLPITEKITNSRGQLRTILVTPKRCHKCGTPTTDYQALREKDLHESVVDTLHRGDSRFIVDHRRFDNLRDAQSSSKKNERVWTSPVDWRDDMESFRLHMSRQSQHEDDLETSDQASEQKRSESGSSVFMTEPGANIDQINEPPDVRCAWDDGSTQAEVTRDYENENVEWEIEDETRNYCSENDVDSFSDFEVIEDYDPESGLTVRLRRRPFASAEKTSYVIRGIHDDETTRENSKAKGAKLSHRNQENLRHKQETDLSRKSRKKQISADKKESRPHPHDVKGNDEELEQNKQKENKKTKQPKSPRHSLPRTDSFYTVGLDRRDYVFSEEPVIVETDEDDVIFDPRRRFSDDSLSDIEFVSDSWSPDLLVSGEARRPPMPSPADQDCVENSSSFSISPSQHDGYLADSEENADLSSLQAQIQQVRNEAKRQQKRRKEERGEGSRKESKGTQERGTQEERQKKRKESEGRKEKAEGSLSQKPQEKETSNTAPLNSGQWDSDWDSDFSLHVQPLNDLTSSSSDDDQRKTGSERRTSNQEPQQRTRKASDKTTKAVLRREEREPGEVDFNKSTLQGGAVEVESRRKSTGETHVREKKSSRKIIVKPIPSIGPGPDSEDAAPRPRPRAPRDEDELSESDLQFFSQQFQAPYPTKGQKNGSNGQSPVGCKGIDCYRCGALIPECQGVCTRCGTWCQLAGGPCSACRDICENCGKPKFRCSSISERLEASTDEDEVEEHGDANDLGAESSAEEKSEKSGKGEGQSPLLVSQEGTGPGLEAGLTMNSTEITNAHQNFQKKKERKNRAPPERKKKDVNNIKRVITKRSNTSINENGENVLESQLMNEVEEEKKGGLEDERLDALQESAEEIPLEDPSSKPAPSAFPSKSTKKAKPSKKVISQTVVYKEKEKPTKSKKRTSLQEQEKDNTGNEDLLVMSPTTAVQTVGPGDEMLPTNTEGTGEDVNLTEQGVGNEPIVNEITISVDVNTKSEEGEKIGNEKKLEKEKEKEAQEKKNENKKNVIPKIRGVSRVNAAFKERAELAKRLQNVLKEAISDVIGQADIKTRKDSTIDYLTHYRLVDRSHLEMYGRAFTLEDEDEDGIISYEQMLLALEGVPSIAGMSRKQLLFVLQVLELFPGSRITFKMFSVTTALCEKVTVLDASVKKLFEELDLFELECKLDLFRKMFFVTGDYSVNFITADQLRIELKAGGLNQKQEDHVIGHILQSTQAGEISFLDYMAYLPLFLSIHKNICDNALDMSRDKYQRSNIT